MGYISTYGLCCGVYLWIGLLIVSPTTAYSHPSISKQDRRPTYVNHREPTSELEWQLFPTVAYNSDLGLGLGALALVTKLSSSTYPFDWRLRILAYSTLRNQKDTWSSSFHNYSISLDIPGFITPKLRLKSVASFKKLSNSGYYGLDSQYIKTNSSSFHHYDRTFPTLSSTLRWQLISKNNIRLEIFGGLTASYNKINTYKESKLEQDLNLSKISTQDGLTLRKFLVGIDDHALFITTIGLLLDTRDHEFYPSRGHFTEISLRYSPGIESSLNYSGYTVSSSFFVPLFSGGIIWAIRGIGDIMLGSVPFYELTSLGSLRPITGLGGTRSLRGILSQRFGGKVKVLANTEFRAKLLPFKLFKQTFMLGVTTFFDAGRSWAGLSNIRLREQSVDASRHSMDLGIGAGLRLRWGKTCVIRFDYAYSPTENTNGTYIDIGHMF